ncbi:hypothetical protein LTR16_001987 [Cryomyces antarcticus]|uniref:Uncharacterized protein n=1 Tax=Cryomyces antarcticus TaxID=329879 RepID=A0ABR0M8A1_9PEZI|nr:hypothetical protein LTR16_001987 [Cryomyces antarcticus]
MPYSCGYAADHVIGKGSSDAKPDISSSWQDEHKIDGLMPIIDRMLDRCEETVRHTSRVLLCWLRSTKPQSCYPKPFTLVALDVSKKKYRRLWKRFFALVFRAYRMPLDVRRRFTAIRFTRKQLSPLQGIWEHEALNNVGENKGYEGDNSEIEEDDEDYDYEGEEEEEEAEEEEEEENHRDSRGNGIDIEDEYIDEDGPAEEAQGSGTAVDELSELVFQLSITFSTEQFVDGQPSSSLLVYFSGTLGFSPDVRNFLPAKRFEHQQFETIRLRYMTTGSPSPLEELQSLRDFGRVMARTDPPSFLLRWSDDGQTVCYGDSFSLTVQDFCSLVKHFLSTAEELCNSLMFDLDPVIDLAKLKDDMTNVQSGFSFVQHPDNGLADAYLDLSAKACTSRRDGLLREDRWDWKAIFLYRKKTEALEEMLAGGLHIGCGQVPRGSELFSLECQNSSSAERGSYVWNGFIIYVTRHHKAKRSTNREFNVVRLLPVQLGHVMYKYVVYIRPFTDMLRREQSSSLAISPSRLLFRSGHALDKPWDSARLTAILKKATTEVWGQSVNSQLYRQLSIGITEKHVREVHKPFNQYDDKGLKADLNVVFACPGWSPSKTRQAGGYS